MKNTSRFIWGIVLIILAIILGSNALGLTDIDIFFDGWWTLLIIIPSFIGVIKSKDKSWSLIWLFFGIIFLLEAQDVISFNLLSKLFFPTILLLIGINLLIPKSSKKKYKIEYSRGDGKYQEDASVFNGKKLDFSNQTYKGGKYDVVFGSLELDLSQAIIEEDIVIEASVIFGGMDIFLPENVNLDVNSTNIFAGTDYKKVENNLENRVTVYLNSSCIFGGIDIK